MKFLLFIFFFNLSFQNLIAQKFFTESGITNFDGSKAAFEPIKASNKNTISIIDSNSGEIAAVILINEFEFRLGLMQEHFNENYLESNIYPKSTFEGLISNFDFNDLNQEFKKYEINGDLMIKGVTNKIVTEANIRRFDKNIELICSFSVLLSDYNVKIPKIVFKKIDEEVKINLNFVYVRKD